MLLSNWSKVQLVDLSQTIYHMQPTSNPFVNQRPAFWDRLDHPDTKGTFQKAPELSWHIRDFLIGEHVSTHVDALCHFTAGDDAWCMERMPLDYFIAPAVCIDLTHKKATEWIHVEDLQHALRQAGLSIQPGDIFLYHQNYYARDPKPPFPQDWTGLDWDATMWLAEQGVKNIGCETPSIDNYQAMKPDSNPCFPAHRVCRERKMTNMENLGDLTAVVGRRFLFIGLPLKLRGGTGCPIRAVAVLEG